MPSGGFSVHTLKDRKSKGGFWVQRVRRLSQESFPVTAYGCYKRVDDRHGSYHRDGGIPWKPKDLPPKSTKETVNLFHRFAVDVEQRDEVVNWSQN